MFLFFSVTSSKQNLEGPGSGPHSLERQSPRSLSDL